MGKKINESMIGLHATDEDAAFIQTMPQKFIDVLAMSHRDYVEAAAELGIPDGTFRSRLHRARARLLRLRAKAAEKEAGGSADAA